MYGIVLYHACMHGMRYMSSLHVFFSICLLWKDLCMFSFFHPTNTIQKYHSLINYFP